MTHSDSWQANFEALKAYVAETGHFPNKHTRLNNWCRYQRKRIKAGLMPEGQRMLFEALAASRSGEHTGGRRKKMPKIRKDTVLHDQVRIILQFMVYHNSVVGYVLRDVVS